MNILRPFLAPWLLLPAALLAQTPAASASTVVFSKPSAAATYTSSHAGATLVKAESNKLTFRNADRSFTMVSGDGVSYRQNGVWAPSQLQAGAFSDGSGWTLRRATRTRAALASRKRALRIRNAVPPRPWRVTEAMSDSRMVSQPW